MVFSKLHNPYFCRAELEHLLRSADQLVWMAEYNKACVDNLIKQIGPSDQQLAGASILCSPKRVEKMKASGTFKVPGHLSNCLGATCIQLQKLGALGFIHTLDCRGYGIANEDMTLLQQHKIKFSNLEAVQIDEQRNLQAWFKWISASQCDLRVIECGFHGAHVKDTDLELIGSYRNLREIALNHVDCSKAALMAFFRKTPNLRKLTMRYPDIKIDGEFMDALSQHCPDLESLELRNPEVSGRPFQKVKFPCMTNFFVEGVDTWEGAPDVAYEDVARACPGLTSFYFDCYNPAGDTITGGGLQAVGSGCRNLESLVCLADEKYLKVLPQSFPNLKKLDVRMAPSEDGIKFIGEISTLKDLSIVGTNITDVSLDRLSPIMPRMKKIKIFEFVKVTDQAFGRLLSQAKSLESFIMSGCRVSPSTALANASKTLEYFEAVSFGANDFKLTHQDLTAMLSFPNLKKILGTMAGGSDQTVPYIIPLLSHLEDLSLGFCSEMTKKGMSQIIASIPKAQSVEIRNLKFKEFDATLLPGMQSAVLSRQVNLQYQKKNPECNIIMYLSN